MDNNEEWILADVTVTEYGVFSGLPAYCHRFIRMHPVNLQAVEMQAKAATCGAVGCCDADLDFQ